MKFYVIGGMFLLLSCRGNKEKNIEKHTPSENLLQKKLLGKWGAGYGTPAFEIRADDSIYFYNNNECYPYKLAADTLYVKFRDRDTSSLFGIMHVIEDTIFFTNPREGDHVTWAYRHK